MKQQEGGSNMVLKALTDEEGGVCFVDVRAVVAIRASSYKAGMTAILLAGGQALAVRGFPAEVHDWLYSSTPMAERTGPPAK